MDQQSQLFVNAYKLMFPLDKHYNLLNKKAQYTNNKILVQVAQYTQK